MYASSCMHNDVTRKTECHIDFATFMGRNTPEANTDVINYYAWIYAHADVNSTYMSDTNQRHCVWFELANTF